MKHFGIDGHGHVNHAIEECGLGDGVAEKRIDHDRSINDD
jgi:hypothetical protein